MTQYRHLKLSAGRIREMADADNFYTSGGREVELLEIVYAGIATQSFTLDGSTLYSLGGYDHVFGLVGTDASASASIVAGGLQLTHTANAAETWTGIGGNQGVSTLFTDIIGKQRLATGRWAVWCRMSWGTIPGTCWMGFQVTGGWPSQYARIARGRNINGQPNDGNGGIFTYSALNGTETSRAGGDYDTHDVMMICCKQQSVFQFFTGVYSGGWPSFEDLTCQGYLIQQYRTANIATYRQINATLWNSSINVGGSANTFSPVIERFRITAYD